MKVPMKRLEHFEQHNRVYDIVASLHLCILKKKKEQKKLLSEFNIQFNFRFR